MSKVRIHQGSESLCVNIVSVNSRYIDFIINQDLSVDMKVPVGMSREMIRQYIRLNESRIFQEYEKKKTRNHQALPITLDLKEGRMIYRGGLYLPFLGKVDTRLRIQYISEEEEIKIYMEKRPDGSRSLVIRTADDSQKFLRYAIMRYYKCCTIWIVKKKAAQLAEKLGLSYHQLSISGERKKSAFRYPRISYQNLEVKNQLTVWGSCNRRKNLKFDWKLAMLPMEIIEYVIVHELVHLKIMNHSASFWEEVERVMPEYQECRNWLAKHGKEYEIF